MYGSIVLLDWLVPRRPALLRMLGFRCKVSSFSDLLYFPDLLRRQQHHPTRMAARRTMEATTTATAIATTLPDDIFVLVWPFFSAAFEALVAGTVTVDVITLPLTVARVSIVMGVVPGVMVDVGEVR